MEEKKRPLEIRLLIGGGTKRRESGRVSHLTKNVKGVKKKRKQENPHSKGTGVICS